MEQKLQRINECRKMLDVSVAKWSSLVALGSLS